MDLQHNLVIHRKQDLHKNPEHRESPENRESPEYRKSPEHRENPERSRNSKAVSWLIRSFLLAGIAYFGFIFPDSFSDHEKMVHFAAHVGMSFFVASFIYILCNIRFRIGKRPSLVILITATLIIGAVYKYWEIGAQQYVHQYSLGDLLTITGCYTSMSQNMAGILASILMIEYVAAYLKREPRRWSPAATNL